MALTIALATLLEKAAGTTASTCRDRRRRNGSRSRARTRRCGCGSERTRGARPVAALSREDVGRALDGYGWPAPPPWPAGVAAARGVADVPALHRLLRRAFQLANTLPDELLHRFERATAVLPRTTEAERLVVQRVGQDASRAGLLDYWEGRSAVTGPRLAGPPPGEPH
jgi:hypothetical protein